MVITIYRNKRNPHKYLEIHTDNSRHNTVRQYIKTENLHTPQYTGDGYLHRWRRDNLNELLSDYEKVMTMDMWYGNKRSDIDDYSVSFSDVDIIYRGNLYSNNKTIGDYSTTDSTVIENTL